MTKIDDMEEYFNLQTDLHKIEMLGEKVSDLLDKIMTYRKKSLAKDGEMSEGNIVYKTLRRGEYLEKLWSMQSKIYDKLNSIN